MRKLCLVASCLSFLFFFMNAQTKAISSLNDFVDTRMRVIIDNDFSGDPDGLFQLAHHLLSPSVDIRGIIGSHVSMGFTEAPATATEACRKVNELLEVMGLSGEYKVLEGSNTPMDTLTVPKESEGARFIIEEAMRTDTKQPLYVVCGASLTTIASAYLMNPEIADRLTLVWIGGQEYEGLAVPPPGYSIPEYNLGLCVPAAQTIFNLSSIPIWQVPRDVYRQCIYSMAEMLTDVDPMGKTGHFLTMELTRLMKGLGEHGFYMGEVYILGDSPLVLLTALQSGFQPDPASSQYVIKQAPEIADDGTYRYNPNGRSIRVYTYVDVRLMFQDMVAKFKLAGQ